MIGWTCHAPSGGARCFHENPPESAHCSRCGHARELGGADLEAARVACAESWRGLMRAAFEVTNMVASGAEQGSHVAEAAEQALRQAAHRYVNAIDDALALTTRRRGGGRR